MKLSTQIGIACICLAAGIMYAPDMADTLMVFPIYFIWATVHSIEQKLNLLLNEKGLLMMDDE